MSDSQGVGDAAATLLTDPDTDIGLLRRIVAKDSDAFDVLYARHVRTVYRAALARVRSVPDAEEITQEAFVTLWRRAASVQLNESLLPWLLATARYVALNRMRSDASRLAHLADADLEARPDGAPTAEDRYEQSRLAAAIAAAVAALSASDQAIYRLCIEDGLGYAEAATSLGLTHGAVRNRLSRVRKSLRTELKDYEKGGRA
ncbi:sigma-70 family RNA polymerase sigma factor [Gryllotalpicola daejeonensis]|uniref:Sigma-70 family RNA polymerase sigma factor n=1 Tax=Gryllotalpicola daejeonensis TaxID=993087 RepID=A0ABP7ZK30_9MICO